MYEYEYHACTKCAATKHHTSFAMSALLSPSLASVKVTGIRSFSFSGFPLIGHLTVSSLSINTSFSSHTKFEVSMITCNGYKMQCKTKKFLI